METMERCLSPGGDTSAHDMAHPPEPGCFQGTSLKASLHYIEKAAACARQDNCSCQISDAKPPEGLALFRGRDIVISRQQWPEAVSALGAADRAVA